MATFDSSSCSPLDLYLNEVDTSKVLVAKTFDDFLPDAEQFIPIIEDCSCTNVNAIYRHEGVDRVAIVLFQRPVTGIRECQNQLRRRFGDVFVFEIEPHPMGLVVVNSCDTDPALLQHYVNTQQSGVGSGVKPRVVDKGQLLVVTFRNTDKVLRQVFSRTHDLFGQPLYFEPYFPCFHDTINEVLSSDVPDDRRVRSVADDTLEDLDSRRYDQSPEADIRQSTSYPNEDEDEDWPSMGGQRSHSPDPQLSTMEDHHDQIQSLMDDVSHPQHSPSHHTSHSVENGRPSDTLCHSDQKRYPSRPCRDEYHYSQSRPRYGEDLDENYKSGCIEEKTAKLDTSDICADEEEKKIVSMCLESPIGQRIRKKFEDEHNCKLRVTFIEKSMTPRRNTQTSSRKKHDSASKNPHADQDLSLALLTLGLCNPYLTPFDLTDLASGVVCMKPLISEQQVRPRVERSDTVTINSVKITVKKGDVTREKADVMVNVVGNNLEFQESLISKAYAKRGGSELCQAYQTEKLSYDGKGIIISNGGKCSCKHLVTIVLDQRTDATSDQTFARILESAFQKVNDFGLKTVALPVMGCGKMLQYPPQIAVTVTVDAAVKAAKETKKGIKEVSIVAFDDRTYEATAKELRTHGRTSRKPKVTDQSSKETVDCCLELTVYGEQKLRRLTTELTSSIRKQFLHTKEVTCPSRMSLRAKAKVYEKAEKHRKTPMKMEFDNTGGTILLKGEKSQVLQTVNSLTELLSSGISAETRKPLCCSPFTWYNLAHTCPVSPPYWTKFGGNTPLTHLSKATRAEKRWTLVPVDKPTEKAVRGLVQATWAEQLVGKGRDAVNLNHKRIRVDKVERIENIDVFSKYAAKRLEQFRMLAEEGSSTLTPLEHAPIKTQGAIATTLKSTSILYEDIFPEINEYYMFHGTKPDVVQTLMMQGLDCRMSDDKAMFGTGIYGAETSTKADQYADPKHHRTPSSKSMLLVRMLLGNMFVCNDQNPTKYRRPPCRASNCLKDNCTSGHEHFDSVVGDGPWLFREFVVYAADQCYPEYLITYHRQ